MPNVSVIIPVHNGARYLRSSLKSLAASTLAPFECLVVDDGSTDNSAEVAREYGAKVISTEGKRGPAHARNLGAKTAAGDVLFFLDSDVCVYPNTIAHVASQFEEDPALDALIGAYDDSPKVKDFLSQYKNLMHCFVHETSRREACTFWSGCGAIRKALFLEHSGFDESYDRPAIEDIELGYRLARARKKMILDSAVRVKHLKAWSFFSLVKTDVMDRGIPWTELILRDRRLPNDLNLQLSQRVSVALMFLLVLMAIGGAFYMGAAWLTPLLALLFLLLSRYAAEGAPSFRYKSTIGMVALGGAIVVLSFWSRKRLIVPPVLLAYLLLFLRHRYSYAVKWRRSVTRMVCGIYLLLTMLFVLTYFPKRPLVWAFFGVLSALIVLNSQFYLFLAAKRGRLFALAAIPFHLLFHFYNGCSFAIGLCRYSLGNLFRAEKRPVVEAAPTPTKR